MSKTTTNADNPLAAAFAAALNLAPRSIRVSDLAEAMGMNTATLHRKAAGTTVVRQADIDALRCAIARLSVRDK